MKILLLSIFLLISTSFKTDKVSEKLWIGTIEVYLNDNDEFEIYYDGNYQRCFTLHIVKRIYAECDSIINAPYLDSLLQFQPIVPEPLPKRKIKTIRM